MLVVMPAHNEGDKIVDPESCDEPARLRRVVVADDGSTDDTRRARRMWALVVRPPLRRGKGAAVCRGLPLVNDCPYVLLVDADSTLRLRLRGCSGLSSQEQQTSVARFPSQPLIGLWDSQRRSKNRCPNHEGVDMRSVLSGQRVLSRRSIHAGQAG